MRTKNVTSFGLALALTASAPSQDKAKDARIDRTPQGKPNVVFILADNIGWGDWSITEDKSRP